MNWRSRKSLSVKGSEIKLMRRKLEDLKDRRKSTIIKKDEGRRGWGEVYGRER